MVSLPCGLKFALNLARVSAEFGQAGREPALCPWPASTQTGVARLSGQLPPDASYPEKAGLAAAGIALADLY